MFVQQIQLPGRRGSHGESLIVSGWTMSVADCRWGGDGVLVDFDAAPRAPAIAHAKPDEIRFGLDGTVADPVTRD